MKKGVKILLGFVTLVFLAFLFILVNNILISAADAAQPAYPLGINPEKIQELPQTPEGIANVSSSYLKTEIGKIVAKIPGLLRIHEFFKAHPMFFTIVFNEPYSISWVFLCIVILWLYIMALTGDIINASRIIKRFGILFGIGISLILSQLGIIKAVVVFTINLISVQSLWWVRLILAVLIILILMLIGYGESIVSNTIKKNKKAQDQAMLEQEAKEGRAFRKGAEEAEEITEPIRELKRKNPLR